MKLTPQKAVKSIAIIALLLFEQSHAFTPVPSSVQPGRVGQSIIKKPSPQRRLSGPSLTPPPAQPPFPAEVAAIRFKLNAIVFEGNTLYSNEALLALFQKPMGSMVTLGDIQKLATDISFKYNEAGYLLSQAVIPEQQITKGVIRIKIIEGFITKINVQGDVPEHTKALMLQYGNKILNKRPLNIRELESALLLAGDLPGMTVRSVITPSKTVENAADLTLLVSFDRMDNTSYITYDDRGTRYIGPTRAIVSAFLNDTHLGSGSATGVRLADSGRQWEQMRYVEVEHKQYLGTNGFMLDFDTQYTRTNPGFLLQGTNTIGINGFYQVSAQYPLIRQRSQNLSVNAAVAEINSFLTQFDTKIYNDQIRTVQLGLQYDSADQYRGSNQLNAFLTQGIDAFGASQPGNLVSRIGAKPSFSKFNLSGGRLQGLFGPFSALLGGSGQYATNTMYSYEQLGYGGLPFGDAYDPSEIVGDRGIEAKLELRADSNFPWTSIPTQYFVYYDGGVLWNFDHINQPGRQCGTSTGVGLRSFAFNHVNLSLELAKPLNRDVAATAAIPGGDENPRAWRGFFSINLMP
jgi:hemolysin activation/secretion protein